jgi:hypothetical protein
MRPARKKRVSPAVPAGLLLTLRNAVKKLATIKLAKMIKRNT